MSEWLTSSYWTLCDVRHSIEVRGCFLMKSVKVDCSWIGQHHVWDMNCHHLSFVYNERWSWYRSVDNFNHAIDAVHCNHFICWYLWIWMNWGLTKELFDVILILYHRRWYIKHCSLKKMYFYLRGNLFLNMNGEGKIERSSDKAFGKLQWFC